MLNAVICVLSLLCAAPSFAGTVHSLGDVPKHLKTPQAKKFFEEQIEGKAAPDRLGVHLPAKLTAAAITGMVVPSSDHAPPTLIGAKPWPAHPDLYVAIVCTGGAGPLGDERQCAPADPDGDPRFHVYLGVIEAKDGASPRLVAAGPADGAIDWSNSPLPKQPMAADGADGPIAPGSFDSFDLAPYKIAPGETAFGLRVGWTESYSGGGASYTGLCLFAMEGNTLKRVLALPMSAYANLAGDWHKDGTRDHDITDSANILVVSSHSTDGHFDLIVKNRQQRWQATYRWSKVSGDYRIAGNHPHGASR